MEDKHYIRKKFLKPKNKPKAEFYMHAKTNREGILRHSLIIEKQLKKIINHFFQTFFFNFIF